MGRPRVTVFDLIRELHSRGQWGGGSAARALSVSIQATISDRHTSCEYCCLEETWGYWAGVETISLAFSFVCVFICDCTSVRECIPMLNYALFMSSLNGYLDEQFSFT